MQEKSEKARFSSFLTTVMTLLGVALGLGNVWRFPYMMGTNGGSAFLLVFIVLMVVIAVPAMMCELALARSKRGATITVLTESFGPFGRFLGYVLVASVFVAGSYYTLVVANVFYSAWFSMIYGFSDGNLGEFAASLASEGQQYLVAVAVLWAALFVIWRGLKGGIERVSDTFVPFFFLVAVYLGYVALTLPGAREAVAEFMRPDFSQIGIRELSAALGQCFFSLGLGATFAMVYGKFISENQKVGSLALIAAAGDTSASVLAAVFIVPTIMVFGLPLDSGPTLLFDTVPTLLAQMDNGRWVGSLLLLALSLVAFLSVVAVFQVVTVSLGEQRIGARLGRARLLILIGLAETALIAWPAWRPEIIGPLDLIIGSWFMVTGGMLAVIAITWSYTRSDALAEIFSGGQAGRRHHMLFLWMRYLIPIALFSIVAGSIYDTITS
ncbi:MAG: sodium-dependent transporter [Pseudomonadota bacterium]